MCRATLHLVLSIYAKVNIKLENKLFWLFPNNDDIFIYIYNVSIYSEIYKKILWYLTFVVLFKNIYDGIVMDLFSNIFSSW